MSYKQSKCIVLITREDYMYCMSKMIYHSIYWLYLYEVRPWAYNNITTCLWARQLYCVNITQDIKLFISGQVSSVKNALVTCYPTKKILHSHQFKCLQGWTAQISLFLILIFTFSGGQKPSKHLSRTHTCMTKALFVFSGALALPLYNVQLGNSGAWFLPTISMITRE